MTNVGNKRLRAPHWLRSALVLSACAVAGMAQAATYNILLKDANGAVINCLTGGFSFDKTTTGTFPVSAPAVAITTNQCLPQFPQVTLSTAGPLSAVVVSTTFQKPGTGGNIETLDNGPNVEGLSGSLQTVSGGFTYNLVFTLAGTSQPFTRSYTLTRSNTNNGNTDSVTGLYHVVNTAAAVPEPGSAALLLTALSALGLLGWRASRRR